jgi:CheY-like chemotaxis protein
MKILVVDDDPQILDAVTVGFQLQWEDCEVVPATYGDQGLARFYEHEPDVVALDVAMPRKNGFEVLQEIRRVSEVPVLMLTARAEETDQVRGSSSRIPAGRATSRPSGDWVTGSCDRCPMIPARQARGLRAEACHCMADGVSSWARSV